MMLMLWEGMRQRAVGAHNLNKDSSRSHSMLTFYLESEEMIEDEPCVKFGKIAFVDLAGTERLKDTQNGEVSVAQADFHTPRTHIGNVDAHSLMCGPSILIFACGHVSLCPLAAAIDFYSVQIESRDEVRRDAEGDWFDQSVAVHTREGHLSPGRLQDERPEVCAVS
jgi:hypothetical protein